MTNGTADSQLCAAILHGLVLIINESQKGKECTQQEENMANGWSAGTESLFPLNEIMDVAWRGLGTAAAAWPHRLLPKTERAGPLLPPAMGCTVL